jgi:hypothetical protein
MGSPRDLLKNRALSRQSNEISSREVAQPSRALPASTICRSPHGPPSADAQAVVDTIDVALTRLGGG